MSDVGDRLRSLRSTAGLSHERLGRQADVDAKRIAFIESGHAFPTQYECQALESALPGCAPQELGLLAYGDRDCCTIR